MFAHRVYVCSDLKDFYFTSYLSYLQLTSLFSESRMFAYRVCLRIAYKFVQRMLARNLWVNFVDDIPENKLNPKHENIFG